MISEKKLVEFYNRAKESGHPDPDRGVLGRAFATNLDNNYSKDGRVGVFGISQAKAKEIGWSDLENAEQNFRAMLDMDARSFQKHQDPLRMLQDTAGSRKEDVINVLDKAFGEVQDKLIIEEGNLVEIKSSIEESEDLLSETSDQVSLDEEAARATSEISTTSQIEAQTSTFAQSGQLERLTALLEEYIDKSIG